MIIVLGSVTLQEGNLEPALALSREHVERSRKEPGCIEHGVHTDPENPLRLKFVEKWADAAAWRAHFTVPESRAFAKAITAMAVTQPTIKVFEATPQQWGRQSLGLVSLVVRDYDEALAFFVGKLGFSLVEDTYVPEQAKRWVVVSPPGASESRLLLAKASSPEQGSRVGNQTGGRVFLFLYTDDFRRDYDRFRENGVEFVRPPKEEPYGTVAVFRDIYGNLWHLLQPKSVVCP